MSNDITSESMSLNKLSKIEVYAMLYGGINGGEYTKAVTYTKNPSTGWEGLIGITVDTVNNSINLETDIFKEGSSFIAQKGKEYVLKVRGFFDNSDQYIESAPVYKILGANNPAVVVNDNNPINMTASVGSVVVDMVIDLPFGDDHKADYLTNIATITPKFSKIDGVLMTEAPVVYTYVVRELTATQLIYSVTVTANVNESFQLKSWFVDAFNDTSSFALNDVDRAPDGQFNITNPYSVHNKAKIIVQFVGA